MLNLVVVVRVNLSRENGKERKNNINKKETKRLVQVKEK